MRTWSAAATVLLLLVLAGPTAVRAQQRGGGAVSSARDAAPIDLAGYWVPDQNPFADEFVNLYHLPREAVLGYRETLYPEYRKKIKDTYVPPPPCTESCGAAGNFVLRRQ